MIDVDIAVRIFVDFLNATWKLIDPLIAGRSYTSDSSSRNDWIQANWELLVERKVLPLNDYLDVYGEGADFNGSSSRITDINSCPTFSICVFVHNIKDVLNEEKIETGRYSFDRFVGFLDGFYIDSFPFDYVLVQEEVTGIERVFLLDSVRFELCKT